MASIGEALMVASGFLNFGARLRTEAPARRPDADDDEAFEPHAGGLAPGEPCFEAVAQALSEAGYLDS